MSLSPEQKRPHAKSRMITRHPVMQEGTPRPNGVFVDEGAMLVKDDVIPVRIGEMVIGTASQMMRDLSTGWISFELKLNEILKLDNYHFSVYSDQNMIATKTGHITSGYIREIRIVPLAFEQKEVSND